MATPSTNNNPPATLASRFKILEETLPPDILESLLTKAVGEYLHNLRVHKLSKDKLKELIEAFPAALSHTNDKGQLPIHSAMWNTHSMQFVALLAEEGVKLNVGGEGNRGGLLVEDPC